VALLDELKCDFVAHGDDITDTYKEVKEAGRLKVIKRTEGISTTDIVGRLLLMTKEHHEIEQDEDESGFHRASSFPDLLIEQKKESSFLPTTRRITQFANGVAPKADSKVVYVDGSFDLFHPGHVAALKEAKSLGDFLYVGIHSDQLVNEKQGSNYPICTLHERALCVLANQYVDEVVFGAPWQVSKELITLLNVSIVAECTDIKFPYETDPAKKFEQSKECYAAAREMGLFVNLEENGFEYCEESETRTVLERIVNNRLSFEKKFDKKSAAEKEYAEHREHVAEA